jgi:hypothetical protein
MLLRSGSLTCAVSRADSCQDIDDIMTIAPRRPTHVFQTARFEAQALRANSQDPVAYGVRCGRTD